jgi:hypothetical protein
MDHPLLEERAFLRRIPFTFTESSLVSLHFDSYRQFSFLFSLRFSLRDRLIMPNFPQSPFNSSTCPFADTNQSTVIGISTDSNGHETIDVQLELGRGGQSG